MEKSFLKAMLEHVKLESEVLAQFRAGLGTLTPADKTWFKERFKIEYGYTIADGQTAAMVVAGPVGAPEQTKAVERGAA